MEARSILPKFLDIGVESEEMDAIVMVSLQNRLKKLKLGIADSILQAEAATLMDNLEGSNIALRQARQLKKEYHHFYAELRRLEGNEESGSDSSDGSAESLAEAK